MNAKIPVILLTLTHTKYQCACSLQPVADGNRENFQLDMTAACLFIRNEAKR